MSLREIAESLFRWFDGHILHDWRKQNPQICPECKTCLSYYREWKTEGIS